MAALTDKQLAWDWLKAESRHLRTVNRSVRVAATERDVHGPCAACPHGWKHHKASGRCRRSCSCRMGAAR